MVIFRQRPLNEGLVRGSLSEYCHAVWYEKIEWFGYLMVKKMKICLFVLTEFTNVADRWTDTGRCFRCHGGCFVLCCKRLFAHIFDLKSCYLL